MKVSIRALAVSLCVLGASLGASPGASPAFAAAAYVDYTGLKLPDGVTVAGDPEVSYDVDADTTNACFRFAYSGTASRLFLHDLAVNGSYTVNDANIARQVIAIPNSNPETSSPACFPLAAGDESNSGTAFYITSTAANSAVGDPSNLDFPDAFTTISTKLQSAGFDTTTAYMAWSDPKRGVTEYHFYVDIQPTNPSAPAIVLSIRNPRLVVSPQTSIALNQVDTFRNITGPDELDFGFTTSDPQIGLGTPQLDADISVATATTFTSTAKLPAGLSISADPSTWYHPDGGDSTFVGDITLTNSTAKPISIGVSGAKMFSVVGQTSTDLKVKAAAVAYMTVPAKDVVVISPFTGGIPGDVRYGAALSFTATIATVAPSTWDSKLLKLPKGFTVEPLDLNSAFYDATAKTTSFTLVVKQAVKDTPAALLFADGTVSGKKQDFQVTDGIRDDGKFRYYFFGLSPIKGDLRIKQAIKIAGTLTAAKKTKVTSTATIDDSSANLTIMNESWRAEAWTYDPVKKRTTISAVLQNDSDADIRVGNCKLSLTVAGKKVTLAKANANISAQWYGWLPIATVAGDLRYGGTAVTIGGTFKVGGC